MATPALESVPPVVDGATFRQETPAGTLRVTINAVDGEPREVFVLLGRAGSETQSFCEGLGRMVSMLLRVPSDLSPAERLALAAEQLKGIGGANQIGYGDTLVLSVVDGLGKILAAYPADVRETETKGGPDDHAPEETAS
jgi:ribonucleoside-diphosphate reductase alpha chain